VVASDLGKGLRIEYVQDGRGPGKSRHKIGLGMEKGEKVGEMVKKYGEDRVQ